MTSNSALTELVTEPEGIKLWHCELFRADDICTVSLNTQKYSALVYDLCNLFYGMFYIH